jgi:hypothetical protein
VNGQNNELITTELNMGHPLVIEALAGHDPSGEIMSADAEGSDVSVHS